MARKVLLMGRSTRFFEYDQADFERFQSQLVNMFQTAKSRAPTCTKPPLLVDGAGEALQRRCRRIFRQAYEYDRNFLFLDAFYDLIPENGNSISFFVRASVFFAFFGRYIPYNSINTGLTSQSSNLPSEARAEDEIDLQRTSPKRPVTPPGRTAAMPASARVDMRREAPSAAIALGGDKIPARPSAILPTSDEAKEVSNPIHYKIELR